MTQANSFKSQIKELSTVQRELSVVIPHEFVKVELDQAYNKLAKKVNLKGFRKGKAPRNVLEQYYKPDIEKEVLNKVLSLSYADAIEKHLLSPVSEPNIEALSQFAVGEDFSYKATVEIKPDIKLQKWSGLKIETPILTLSDDLVDLELGKLQERHSTVTPVTDRKEIETDDLVDCNIEASLNGEAVAALSGTNKTITIGSGAFIAEVEKALVGQTIGAEIVTKAEIPESFSDENLRGKTIDFKITPNTIKTRLKPALDDEFAKDVSDQFETLAALKEAITKSFAHNKEQQEDSEKKHAVIQALIDNNPFEAPNSLVEKQAEYTASKLLAQMPQKQAEQIWQKIGEQLIQEAKPNALKTVKASLICEAIVKDQNIVISEEELNNEINNEAARLNVTVKQLQAHYKEDGINNLKYRLANEKALDRVIENAQITTIEKPFRA
ncbi:MAG: trigger factor [bacterium]|nr:trigger factor [bacterium]